MQNLSFSNSTSLDLLEFQFLYEEIYAAAINTLSIKKPVLLSVNFIDKDEALNLNSYFRSKNYVPDVLSFPAELSDFSSILSEDEISEIGDIFICYDEALNKSKRYQHSIREEMAFLFVHGFLHLLGYDHEKSSLDEKVMFELQDSILLKIGISYNIVFDELDYLRG
ncbi:metalloprotease [Spiroplasma sabaudiense Ar-1343]|uniref:Endoribonuclease YbeY n=1 Tax=Spiroplasma sabaudiense Ar-1343 TaxID=1276257 RepID=W6A9T2_9MOLU|nr:rRNA maturation RNase YbeY [Spiroplasma sabaudiense]AHI53726.1 metalloprotease [Spiroplasma sabaudiense Ar-1343]